MIETPSLARRIALHLIVAQLVAFVAGGIVTIGLELAHIGFYRISSNELAVPRVSAYVIDSLIRGDDGEPRIAPIAQLAEEMQRTPGFKFAAFTEARQPIAGSSPELASILSKIGIMQVTMAHLHFNLPGDTEMHPLGYIERRRTAFGWMHIAVYRQKFRWDDIIFYLADVLQWMSAYISVVVLFSVATMAFAVRRSLTPLRDAAEQVRLIDLDTLNNNVIVRSVPLEIIPFVDAIDAALARVRASANRLRRFTANAAHELRTPLAIMRARLDNAAESDLKDDLLSDSSQLRVIVEQMLIATRLFENQASNEERFDVTQIAKKVVSDFLLLALKLDKVIKYEGAKEGVMVEGNRRAVECVIANLVDNALRAEPKGGYLIVAVDEDVTVSVIDHGEGVAHSDREIVFEPFWRKSEATPGTGLGLGICKELMEKLGGRIWVEDTPGGGATFKLSFPRPSSN